MVPVNQKDPFFIVGCPRSGTTLFQLLLDAHPAIAIPPESHFFVTYRTLFEKSGFDIMDSRHFKMLFSLVEKDWRIKNWHLSTPLEDIFQETPNSIADFINTLFYAYARQEGKTHWGDKTPQHALCLEKIAAAFPRARIIHLVRDGRDVAESLRRVHIGPQSIPGRAWRWKQYMQSIKLGQRYFPTEQFLEVRFEDLLQRPETIMAAVFQFLGEDSAVERRIAVHSTAAGRYKSSSSLHEFAAKPLSGKKVGIYKKCLTAREQEIFAYIAGEQLAGHGYTVPDGTGKGNPVLWECIWFCWQDYVWRYVRKILSPKDYGLAHKQVRDWLHRCMRAISFYRLS